MLFQPFAGLVQRLDVVVDRGNRLVRLIPLLGIVEWRQLGCDDFAKVFRAWRLIAEAVPIGIARAAVGLAVSHFQAALLIRSAGRDGRGIIPARLKQVHRLLDLPLGRDMARLLGLEPEAAAGEIL